LCTAINQLYQFFNAEFGEFFIVVRDFFLRMERRGFEEQLHCNVLGPETLRRRDRRRIK
jgi:hypothetical protein